MQRQHRHIWKHKEPVNVFNSRVDTWFCAICWLTFKFVRKNVN